jgi:serine/threonine protein kinase
VEPVGPPSISLQIDVEAGALEGPPPEPALPAGTRVGEYELVELIARGGMGAVYLAMHPVIGKKVAVKILHSDLAGDAGIAKRFVQEARAANQVGHPGIVDIFAFGQLPDGRLYYVMECLAGETLLDRLCSSRPLSWGEKLDILGELCDALEAAHQAGIIHRDLKPDNVFLADLPGGRRVKVLDFGIAKLLHSQSRNTRTGMHLGTPRFMSPEQCLGHRVDARTDVYGLGILMFSLFTGRTPFWGTSYQEVMERQISSPPPRPGRFAPLPEELEALILACLEKDPARRPGSMAEVRRRLQTLAHDSDELPELPPPSPRRSEPGPRGPEPDSAVVTLPSARDARGWESFSGGCVLSVLCCEVPALVRALLGPAMQRLGVTLTTVPQPEDLVACAIRLRPNVVILAAGALEPARRSRIVLELRAVLADSPLLVLLALEPDSPHGHDAGLFDGVVMLAAPELDLERQLLPLVTASRRRAERLNARIPVSLTASGEAPIEGLTVDVNEGGAGLLLPRRPVPRVYRALFHRSDGRQAVANARPSWIRGQARQVVRAGIRFVQVTPEFTRALHELALWELRTDPAPEHGSAGRSCLHLYGRLAGDLPVDTLTDSARRAEVIDLGEVTEVDAAGTRLWVELVDRLAPRRELRLVRIAVPLVRQMKLVPEMIRRCVVESYFANFTCARCAIDTPELLTPERSHGGACRVCGGARIASEPTLAFERSLAVR